MIHTHIPIFHTEHCVFARFLSNGDSYLDCGHVCTRNTIHLRDVNQKDNLVLADMGCRNTIFSANVQSGVHSINKWSSKHCNIGTFRIELVDELNDDVEKIIDGHMKVLSHKIKPNVCWDMLKSVRLISLNGLDVGRHTLHIQGTDSIGYTGPLSSIFFIICDPDMNNDDDDDDNTSSCVAIEDTCTSA